MSVDPAVRLFRHPPFRWYFGARTSSEFALQVSTVALGWQVYAKTNSALALGMIGLTQFVPSAVLLFAAGHAADRFDRRRVVQTCQVAGALTAGFLAWGSVAGWLTVPEIFVAVAVLGTADAFISPAAAALLPAVVPAGMLQRATALTSAANQVAVIAGPALGGLAYALSPGVPYGMMAAFWLGAAGLNGVLPAARPATADDRPTALDLFAGIRFVRDNPAILGSISLDLVAVLLGGATALLPIYARDILHTGPWGLGVLRGAPAIGALLMTAVLARRPMTRAVGMRMFVAVIVFGVATIAFAFSRALWFSLAALAVMGAADMVSMVVRGALVQLRTPDHMRGRVSAVNFLFINASNELGAFESGLTAALFGAVPAAALGGIGTVVVALVWMGLFPALRNVERLE